MEQKLSYNEKHTLKIVCICTLKEAEKKRKEFGMNLERMVIQSITFRH